MAAVRQAGWEEVCTDKLAISSESERSKQFKFPKYSTAFVCCIAVTCKSLLAIIYFYRRLTVSLRLRSALAIQLTRFNLHLHYILLGWQRACGEIGERTRWVVGFVEVQFEGGVGRGLFVDE